MSVSKSLTWRLSIALFLLGYSCWVAAEATNNSIEFSPCELRLPGTSLSAKAECGTRLVAENPADPTGRHITINVAQVAAIKQDQKVSDPVFFLAGGPGQSATESYPVIAGALTEINETRDIILVDQRGTGGSNKLSCDYGDVDLELEMSIDEVVQQTRECSASLAADPRFYTTTIGMQDVDNVRAALGYAKINLIGVSYGTRAAQVYLREFPEHVRSMVLDSVVPPQLLLGLEHAQNLDHLLSKVFQRCQHEKACGDRFGNLDSQLAVLRETVLANPPMLHMRMPTTGEYDDVLVNRDVLAVAVRLLSYSSETQALLPILLEQASLGDWQPLASQAMMQVENLDDAIARGMELSVLCSEDEPFFPADINQNNTLLGQLLIDLITAQCKIWPRGEVAADFHQPRANDQVPVLLLSGEYDPVTPPKYGDQAAEQFSNSAHWVIPGQGHSVMRHGCLPSQIAIFMDSADLNKLDASCIESIGPAPFFLSMTGPSP